MFKNEGGGVKGRLNNVQKNRRFGPAGRPLGSLSEKKYGIFWEFFPNVGPPTPPFWEFRPFFADFFW